MALFLRSLAFLGSTRKRLTHNFQSDSDLFAQINLESFHNKIWIYFEDSKTMYILCVLIGALGDAVCYLLGLKYLPGYGHCHWPMIDPWYKFLLPLLILKVQRTYMSWDFDDVGGSWLGFWILTLIVIWSLVFNTSKLQILANETIHKCKRPLMQAVL